MTKNKPIYHVEDLLNSKSMEMLKFYKGLSINSHFKHDKSVYICPYGGYLLYNAIITRK